MKKLAMFVGGTALAAGVVLVPVGAASAATTSSTHTAVASVTSVHPQDVSAWECEAYGGFVEYDAWSPSGYVCIGGYFHGEVVWY